MRVQDPVNINMVQPVHIGLILLSLLVLYAVYISIQTRNMVRAALDSKAEAFADPTRAVKGNGGKRRVSDTERTKILNSGGRKGYV
jgi:hypothetical protein